MNVYFISGMGADCRIFEYIHLPEGFQKIYLDWIGHRNNETLKEYSLRLAENIDHEKPFILIGVSMGGMIAVEIAKIFKPAFTILISSAATKSQLSPFFNIVRKTHIYKFVPVGLLKSLSLFKRNFSNEDRDIRRILRDVIQSSDNKFLKWAIPAVLSWDNKEKIQPLCHIHGTKDEIISPRYIEATHWVPGGTHMMIMVRAGEINELISKELKAMITEVNK